MLKHTWMLQNWYASVWFMMCTRKRQRVAQNAIAISKITDTLDANIPPDQQTPVNLQQFIFCWPTIERQS